MIFSRDNASCNMRWHGQHPSAMVIENIVKWI